MVSKNTRTDKLTGNKKFAKRDTSYSSFWLYNREADINSEHFKDSFVNFYDDKELLSEFNPTTAKNIISFWSEKGDTVLDPFSGRTRALVSYAMNRKYIGFEVSKDVTNYMNSRFDDLKLREKPDFNVNIINDDCYNIDKTNPDLEADLVFSCPPYWNLEKYESCKGQLSDIKDYHNFIKELKARLLKSVSKLKPGGYMCMVVGDFRKNKKYITFHSDLIQTMSNISNIKLHDVIVIQNIPFATAAFYFGSRKKHKYTAKAHEYLLVWKKKGGVKVKNVLQKKWTINDMCQKAKDNNGLCLSKHYKNMHTKLKWQCSKGHVWKATPHNIINRKQWCPRCSSIRSNSSRKIPWFDIQQLAKSKGGFVLSKKSEYINTNSKLKWKCNLGHTWYASIDSIKNQNTWCPYCKTGYKENFTRFVFEQLTGLSFVKARPSWLKNPVTGRLLELDGYNEYHGLAFEYNGQQHYEHNNFFHKKSDLVSQQSRDNLKSRLCDENNVKLCIVPSGLFDDDIINFIRSWCKNNGFKPSYSIDTKKFCNYKYSRHEKFKRFVESLGYELLNNFKTVNEKVHIRCNNGHDWYVQPRAVNNGNRCPYCSGKFKHTIDDVRVLADNVGLELLSKKYTSNLVPLKFCCKNCGLQCFRLISELRNGKGCVKCD